MSTDDAVFACRTAYPIDGVRWPTPLIAYLDAPSSERRVFEWLISCVSEILDHLGANTPELADSLSLARSCVSAGDNSKAIEVRALDLWNRRMDAPAKTAVAQLLFALLAYRDPRQNALLSRVSCATPLVLLDRMANDRGVILERVVSHFTEYAGR